MDVESFVHCFCNNENLLSWLTFCVSIIGGFFALYKWRKDISINRTLQFRELLNSIRTDSDMCHAIYKLDDDTKEWFSRDFPDSVEAVSIDKLLFHFCYVIYLSENYIGKMELRPLTYEIERTLHNPQLQDYLYNLQKYSEEKGLTNPFDSLVQYGLKKKILDFQFDDKKKNVVRREKNLKFHFYYKEWLNEEKLYAQENY